MGGLLETELRGGYPRHLGDAFCYSLARLVLTVFEADEMSAGDADLGCEVLLGEPRLPTRFGDAFSEYGERTVG